VSIQPAEPLDRIDEIIARLAASSPGDDVSALGGELGLAWLELYERDGDEDALRAGVGCLRRTIASVTDHPDRSRWFLGLGLGYAERARRNRCLSDYHEAMNWLSVLYSGSALGGEPRRRLAVTLGELCWERYWLVRYSQGVSVPRALTENTRLLGRIIPLLAAPADPEDLADTRLIAGFTLLERYELTGEPAALERGIDLLASASFWELPADDPRRCQAGSELAEALRQLSIMDEDPATLDRALAVATRTIASSGPTDGTARFLLYRYTANAAFARWRARRDLADLDLAYRCWQPLLPLGMDSASGQEYAAVLAEWRRTVGPDRPPAE
jgi:hypothetical protein